MNKTICIFFMIAFLLSQMGCDEKTRTIQSIIIDFPHGEDRLLVQRNGEAYLFYGALPRHRKIKDHTFDIDELYKQLKPRLHDNLPREKWPDPTATFGMVTIRFDNDVKKDSLIFREETFAENLFNKARENIIGQIP